MDNKMISNEKYCVYKHTSPSGKIYIGITRQRPEKRWQSGYGYNKERIGTKTHFFNAIKKYGWHNFKHEIIIEGLTESEAKKKEIELIALYDSTNPDKGYNVSPGGNVVSKESIKKSLKAKAENGTLEREKKRMKKLWENEEWRRNTVERMQNKPRNEEQKKHYKEAAKCRIGIPLSQTTKMKLSQKAKERIGEKSSRRKKVFQISPVDGSVVEVFATARQAAINIGAGSIGSISNACRGDNGKNQIAHGYYWCYAIDYEKFKENMIIGVELDLNGHIRKVPRVMCVETGEIYESASDAARAIGVKDDSQIMKQIYGDRKTVKGYTWKFVDKDGTEIFREKPNTGMHISDHVKEAISASHRKQVMCIETGIVYKSIKEAAIAAGLKESSATAIVKQINGKTKTAGGHTWTFI